MTIFAIRLDFTKEPFKTNRNEKNCNLPACHFLGLDKRFCLEALPY